MKPPTGTLLLACALFALAGCETPQRWGVPTTFVVNNLAEPPKDVYTKLERALGVSKYPVTEIKVLSEDPFTIQLENIQTYAQLEEARRVMERVLSRDFEPTRLSAATLTFQSVTGSAKAMIQVSGKATPGSVVYVDVGSPEPTKIAVTATGEWSLAVKPNPRLLDRKGQLYALIIKEQTFEVIELNAFKPGDSDRISQGALPTGSSLLTVIKAIPQRELPPAPKEPDHRS